MTPSLITRHPLLITWHLPSYDTLPHHVTPSPHHMTPSLVWHPPSSRDTLSSLHDTYPHHMTPPTSHDTLSSSHDTLLHHMTPPSSHGTLSSSHDTLITWHHLLITWHPLFITWHSLIIIWHHPSSHDTSPHHDTHMTQQLRGITIKVWRNESGSRDEGGASPFRRDVLNMLTVYDKRDVPWYSISLLCAHITSVSAGHRILEGQICASVCVTLPTENCVCPRNRARGGGKRERP